jgi:hypothetical protein
MRRIPLIGLFQKQVGRYPEVTPPWQGVASVSDQALHPASQSLLLPAMLDVGVLSQRLARLPSLAM